MSGECHICATLSSGDPGQVILDDGTWQVFNVAGVPGWTMLAPHEHVEGVSGLSDAQAERLGPLLKRVGAAVQSATGAQRVHVVYLGDSALHFHVGLFPRQAGEVGLLDNARMVAEVKERQDPEAARPLSALIREQLI